MSLQQLTDHLIESQVSQWDLAARNYAGLASVVMRTIPFDGFEVLVQYNPERIRSSAAKVDAKSIEARPCFLCAANLPPQQKGVGYGYDYTVLVNPFPIFTRHLTIPKVAHTDQLIHGSAGDMLTLSRELYGFVLFYNGPKCGASAPDHFHFQAGNRVFLPIEADFESKKLCYKIKQRDDVTIYGWKNYLRGVITLEGGSVAGMESCFESIWQSLRNLQPNEVEPMLNILSYYEDGIYVMHLFPRKLHRPWQFFEEGDKQILLSPASVDMGGVLITPRVEDFEKITASDVQSIFSQVCLSQQEADKLTNNL